MPGEKVTTLDAAFGDERSRGPTLLSFEQRGQSMAEPAPVSTTRRVELEHGAPPACPRCRRGDVRRSHARGPLDALARALGFRPFRCRACRARYFAAH